MKLTVQEYLDAEGNSPYLILLLLGGDKSTQGRDIREAQLCWAEFLEALKNGEA